LAITHVDDIISTVNTKICEKRRFSFIAIVLSDEPYATAPLTKT
jgi:hypothetical protein